jgi:hypothetical protein
MSKRCPRSRARRELDKPRPPGFQRHLQWQCGIVKMFKGARILAGPSAGSWLQLEPPTEVTAWLSGAFGGLSDSEGPSPGGLCHSVRATGT